MIRTDPYPYLLRPPPAHPTAVEEALRLREKSPKLVTSITALTIGPTKSVETLRTALAMGADSGIHILTPDSQPSSPEPLGVARAIAHIAREKKIDLIILGKQAIDDDSGATGGMVAGILGWGQGSFASKLEIEEGGKVKVTREIDGGLERLESKLPLVVTTDLRLNGELHSQTYTFHIMRFKWKADISLNNHRTPIRFSRKSFPCFLLSPCHSPEKS